MSDNETRTIFVEAPSGERFEANVPCDTQLSRLAADFFEAQSWPTQDARGRGQRAVVELVNPENPDNTKRLNGREDICESGVEDGDVLRVFPESVAGAIVDQRARLVALIADQNEMDQLVQTTPEISYEGNRDRAADLYTVTFAYTSFVELPAGYTDPITADSHVVEILLGAGYPRLAPLVTWQTPIFHPNIRQTNLPNNDAGHGAVCLGVLSDRYLPSMGLARLVRMLAEMVQWRNFDAFNAFNREASQWAADPTNWDAILAIGGHPFQGPVEQLFKEIDRSIRPAITFQSVGSVSQVGIT